MSLFGRGLKIGENCGRGEWNTNEKLNNIIEFLANLVF